MSVVRIINGPQVAAQMSGAVKEIARMTGFSERQVTLAEAGSILKQWAGRTKMARPDQIDLRTRVKVLHALGLTKSDPAAGRKVTINAGRRGTAGLVYFLTNHKQRFFRVGGVQGFDGSAFNAAKGNWDNKTGANIRDAVADSGAALRKAIPMARKSAGLARQSVVQIADDLGIRLENVPGGGASTAAIAKARAAISSSGRYYVNGLAAEHEQAGKSYFVTLINRLPYHAKAGLDATLAGVLAGRVGLFRRTFANGAFKSIAAAAHNYPWIKTALGST